MNKEDFLKKFMDSNNATFEEIIQFIEDQLIMPVEVTVEQAVGIGEKEHKVWITFQKALEIQNEREKLFGKVYGEVTKDYMKRYEASKKYYERQGLNEGLIYEPRTIRLKFTHRKSSDQVFKDMITTYGVIALWSEWISQSTAPNFQWTTDYDSGLVYHSIEMQLGYGS